MSGARAQLAFWSSSPSLAVDSFRPGNTRLRLFSHLVLFHVRSDRCRSLYGMPSIAFSCIVSTFGFMMASISTKYWHYII